MATVLQAEQVHGTNGILRSNIMYEKTHAVLRSNILSENTNHELCQPLLNGLKAGVESNILSENKSTEPILVCVLLMQWQLLGGDG
jgi:hypothetical protein